MNILRERTDETLTKLFIFQNMKFKSLATIADNLDT